MLFIITYGVRKLLFYQRSHVTTTQLRKLHHVCLRTRNPVLFMDCDACGLEEESSPRFSPVSRVWWRQRGRRKQSETPGES